MTGFCWTLLWLLPFLGGCSGMPSGGESGVVARVSQPPVREAPTPLDDRSSNVVRSSTPQTPPGEGPLFTFDPQDPSSLRTELARQCEVPRAAQSPERMEQLVGRLYLSGVDPASGIEALIRSGCGPLDAMVQEMVAQGGEESVDPVVARALLLSGPGTRSRIEAAAVLGLERAAAAAVAAAEGATGSLSYGMAYFPSYPAAGRVETALALNSLYEQAVPGYGLYTFVLLGRGFGAPEQAGVARDRELFRVIETYVSGAPEGGEEPDSKAHVFLIPVHPSREEGALIDQIAPTLADLMRRDLVQALRRGGQTALATRVERGAGPFLVASPEPRLLPANRASPRLVTDLSEIGPEYLYDVVDAFDRAVPAGLSGRPESLGAIRERLLKVWANRDLGPDPRARARETWLIMLGGVDDGVDVTLSVAIDHTAGRVAYTTPPHA